MADLLAVTKRAQEIVQERFLHWYEKLQEEPDRATDMPQRTRRAEYEALRKLPLAEFEAAVGGFDERYGEGEFARQTGLGLRRRESEAER